MTAARIPKRQDGMMKSLFGDTFAMALAASESQVAAGLSRAENVASAHKQGHRILETIVLERAIYCVGFDGAKQLVGGDPTWAK
jgi:hypothetical protein